MMWYTAGVMVTVNSTAAIVEAPIREELVRIFAQRYPNLPQKKVGACFDKRMAAGCLDVRRDELTGEWLVLLSGKRTRQ